MRPQQLVFWVPVQKSRNPRCERVRARSLLFLTFPSASPEAAAGWGGEDQGKGQEARGNMSCVHFFLYNYALGCHEPRGGVSRGWLRAWAACWEGEKFTGLGDICCHPSEGLSPVGLIFKAVRSQDVSSALLGTGLLG